MSDPHMHHPAEGSLYALVDGELGAQRAAIEAHVARCALCAEQVHRLELLRRTAAALPRELTPPDAVWAGVEARIRRDAITPSSSPSSTSARVERHGRTWRWLVAASLACASGLAGAYVRGRNVAPVDAAAAGAIATIDPVAGQLRELIAGGSGNVPLSVIADIEQNLQVLDSALERTEAALEADPNNVQLEAMVERSLRHRADFVSSTLALLADF